MHVCITLKVMHTFSCLRRLAYLFLVIVSQPLLAGQLPQVDPKAQAALQSKGNWLEIVERYLGQGGKLLALSISVLGFIWVSYAALAKFNECRTGRAEWSELGVLVIAAAALLVFITLLLTQTQSILPTDFSK